MMSKSPRPRTARKLLHTALAALLATTVLGGLTGGPVRAEAPQPARHSTVADRPYTVTLVTGDRVLVQPRRGGRPAIRIQRASGRQGMRFVAQRTAKAGLRVIPVDAMPLIAADRLDPRLFDVVLLRRLGYDDAHRNTLPLIVTGRPGAAPHAFTATRGSSEQRTLPKIGATIVHQQKGSAPSFWSSVRAGSTSAPRMAAAGVRKIWLSSAYRPLLDRSVPQIGGPAAWNAGYTGAGVPVAVLDTGIDATHPDFAGAIQASRDFSGSSVGVRDQVGHGTHVASILAGRGTASAGKYTGVAKGASLLIGKVCTSEYCTEEAILAGMEWAATQHATVANVSLGGPVGDGPDPVVAAVDTLTQTDDTLFVVAAGNSGPEAETVGSPATASSALAVGSVGRTDDLSFFSSRGPRVNASRRLDYAIKPDITAPGEDIVAAQAQGIDPIGDPVNQWYQSLSGTSMATPHVAGAAAILAQQHPDFTAGELKAALMGSAAVRAGLTVYEQGAGRVDLARAVSQRVFADHGSLSLGYFPWPNNAAPPATQTLTYRNTGSTPVTLSLSATFADAAGHAAAPGVLRLGRSTVTVPAAGSASVPVTITPAGAALGLYSGRLLARSADGTTVVTTPLGAYKEPESYNVDLTAIGPDGQQPQFGTATVMDPTTGLGPDLFLDGGVGLVRLRVGNYVMFSMVGGESGVAMAARTLSVHRTTEVVLDARRGNPVSLTAPGVPDAVPDDFSAFTMDFDGTVAGWSYLVFALPDDIRIVPTSGRIPRFSHTFMAELHKEGTGSEATPTPYVYHGTYYGAGTLPARPTYRITAANSATVIHRIARQTADETITIVATSTTPGWGMVSTWPLGSRTTRTDRYSTGADVSWSSTLSQAEANAPDDGMAPTADIDSYRTYRAGERRTEWWNTAVTGPAWPSQSPSTREGNVLTAPLALTTDSQPDHAGAPNSPFDSGTAKLYRGSALIATSDSASYLGATDLPAADSEYRLVADNTRTAGWARLSTRIQAAWTFHSAHTDGPANLPLSVVRFSPHLDALSRAPATGTFAVPVRVERQPGSTPAEVASLAVQASYDDGATWVSVPLSGSGANRTATLTHPGHSGFVSLRATSTATDGASVTQTIIRAYALGPSS